MNLLFPKKHINGKKTDVHETIIMKCAKTWTKKLQKEISHGCLVVDIDVIILPH